jgi:hypothetical protein
MPNKDRDFLIFSAAFRGTLVLTESHIQWVECTLSPEKGLSELEAHHSLLSSVEGKNVYDFAHHIFSWLK